MDGLKLGGWGLGVGISRAVSRLVEVRRGRGSERRDRKLSSEGWVGKVATGHGPYGAEQLFNLKRREDGARAPMSAGPWEALWSQPSPAPLPAAVVPPGYPLPFPSPPDPGTTQEPSTEETDANGVVDPVEVTKTATLPVPLPTCWMLVMFTTEGVLRA